MKSLISLVLSLLVVNTLEAQSLNARIQSSYSSIRALGMGDAFTAVADDYSLILYNPAGFARKKHNEVQVTLLGAGVSSKTLTVAKDISDASDVAGSDADKAQAVSDVLEKYYGEALGGKVQALEMFWVRNGWGVAILPMDLTMDMSVNRQLGPAIDLHIIGDTSAAIGFGKEINKFWDAGITVKYTHRVSVEQTVPAFELASNPDVLSKDRFREGSTTDFDIGVMWRPNWFNTETVSQTEDVKVITPVEAPAATTDAPKADEPKKDEKVADDKKADDKDKKDSDKKPEEKAEERKPQSEEGTAVAQSSARSGGGNPAPETPAAPTSPEATTPAPAPEATAATPAAPAPEVKKEEAAKVEEKTETVTTEKEVAKDGEERFPLTLGLVVHNVIGGEFTLSKMVNKDATVVPTKMYRVFDVGSQYRLVDGENLVIRAMLDFKNLGHPEITAKKATHVGLEFDFSPSTWFKTQFRAGLNQGYYTAGASFLFAVINIDVATYGEEVGTGSITQENRVIAAKLGMNF